MMQSHPKARGELKGAGARGSGPNFELIFCESVFGSSFFPNKMNFGYAGESSNHHDSMAKTFPGL
jgi:hypothetical protein